MLSSFGRRNTISRSFMNFNNRDDQPSDPSSYGLYSVTLSDSIQNLDHLSPGLYNWLFQGDYAPRHDLKFFSPSGELITEGLPRHLLRQGILQEAMEVTSVSRSALESARKQIRKPVEGSTESRELRRFFLNLMTLDFKTDAEDVIGIITIANQKRTTSCLPLVKSKSKKAGCVSMEGFIFDIPKPQTQDLIISILFYSKSKRESISNSPSFQNLNNSFLSFSRTNSNSNSVNDNFYRNRVPAGANEIGYFLGDCTLRVPSSHSFAKLSSTHAIHANGKQVGTLGVEMGVFSDIEFIPVPEIPVGFGYHEDYLNTYLYTEGGLVWDKKWVVCNTQGMWFYSGYYKSGKQTYGYLPYTLISKVSIAKLEFMAAPNALVLSIKMPWRDDKEVFATTPLSLSWKDQFVEAGIKSGDLMVDCYVTADSQEQMNKWKDFLQVHITRAFVGNGISK